MRSHNPKRGKQGETAKRDTIIAFKLNNPNLSLKEIASITCVNYSYARYVWSRYVSGNLTIRGRPSLPIHLHGWFWMNNVPTEWYDRAPMAVSRNEDGSLQKNRQKVHQHKHFTFVIFPSGAVYVYPFFPMLEKLWRSSLTEWLRSWLSELEVSLFIDSLYKVGKKHIAVQAPGIQPKGFRFHLKNVGTFSVEKRGTPFEEGTLEYEADLGFENRLRSIQGIVGQFKREMETIERGGFLLSQRMTRQEDISIKMAAVVKTLGEDVTKLSGEISRLIKALEGKQKE